MVRQLVPQHKGTQTPRMEPRAATQLGVQPRLSGYLVGINSAHLWFNWQNSGF